MPAQAALKFIPQSVHTNPAATENGLCSFGVDPELFFREDEVGVAAAKRLCAACPLAAACLAYATENVEYGIWGGLTPAERDELRGGPLQLELRSRSLEAERLLNAGRTTAEVADALGVVERTVYRFKRARAAYYEGLNSPAQAA